MAEYIQKVYSDVISETHVLRKKKTFCIFLYVDFCCVQNS